MSPYCSTFLIELKIGGFLPKSAGKVAYILEKTPLKYDNVVRMSISLGKVSEIPEFLTLYIK